MGNSSSKKHELRQISRYKALVTARHCLLLMLLLLTLYVGYYGYSLVPFYLLVVLALLPSLILQGFSDSVQPPASLPYVRERIGYSRQKHRSVFTGFALTLALLFLWNLRHLSLTQTVTVLKLAPAILIISSLMIYTIGQYIYFHLFNQHLMNNELDKIR